MFVLLEALDHIGFLAAYDSGNSDTILVLQDGEVITGDTQLIQFFVNDVHSLFLRYRFIQMPSFLISELADFDRTAGHLHWKR